MTFQVVPNSNPNDLSWEDELERELNAPTATSQSDNINSDEAMESILADSLKSLKGSSQEQQDRMKWFEASLSQIHSGEPFGEVALPFTLDRGAITLSDLVKKELPPPVPLIGGLLSLQESMLLHAPSGAGKSLVAQMLSTLMSSSPNNIGLWNNGEGNHRVLYVDGEMSMYDAQKRFKGMEDKLDATAKDMMYYNVVDNRAFDFHLMQEEYQDIVLEYIERTNTKLVVIDNYRTLMGGESENDAQTVSGMGKFIDKIHSRGASCILIHHSNKAPGKDGWPVYAGSTNFERPFNVVMSLKTVQRYTNENKAQIMGFNITKQRGVLTQFGNINICDDNGISVTGKGVEPIQFTTEEQYTLDKIEKKYPDVLSPEWEIPAGQGSYIWRDLCTAFHDLRGFKDDKAINNLRKLIKQLQEKGSQINSQQGEFKRV